MKIVPRFGGTVNLSDSRSLYSSSLNNVRKKIVNQTVMAGAVLFRNHNKSVQTVRIGHLPEVVCVSNGGPLTRPNFFFFSTRDHRVVSSI